MAVCRHETGLYRDAAWASGQCVARREKPRSSGAPEVWSHNWKAGKTMGAGYAVLEKRTTFENLEGRSIYTQNVCPYNYAENAPSRGHPPSHESFYSGVTAPAGACRLQRGTVELSGGVTVWVTLIFESVMKKKLGVTAGKRGLKIEGK